MTWLLTWARSVWPYIIAGAGVLAALVTFGASERARGRMGEQLKRAQEKETSRRQADAVGEDVRKLDDDAVLSEFDKLHNDRRR